MTGSQQLPLRDVQLNLSFIDANVERMRAFANWLVEDTQVTDLQLCFGHIKGESTRFLADAFRVNRGVRTLRLGGCNIQAVGADYLTHALGMNVTLHALGLSHNHLGANGAEHVARSLSSNTVLQKLDLGSNMIGEQGAEFLANFLKANHTLRALRLHGNVLRDVGANRIAEGLKENQGLLDLCLSCNCITDSGAFQLAKAVRQNTALARLDLSRNNIGEPGADALVAALNESSLAMLCLASNPLGKPVESWLADSFDDPRQAHDAVQSLSSHHRRGRMMDVASIASMLPRLDMNCTQSTPSLKPQAEPYRPSALKHHDAQRPLKRDHAQDASIRSVNALEVLGCAMGGRRVCSRSPSRPKCSDDMATLEGTVTENLDFDAADSEGVSSPSPLQAKQSATIINLLETGFPAEDSPVGPPQRLRPRSAPGLRRMERPPLSSQPAAGCSQPWSSSGLRSPGMSPIDLLKTGFPSEDSPVAPAKSLRPRSAPGLRRSGTLERSPLSSQPGAGCSRPWSGRVEGTVTENLDFDAANSEGVSTPIPLQAKHSATIIDLLKTGFPSENSPVTPAKRLRPRSSPGLRRMERSPPSSQSASGCSRPRSSSGLTSPGMSPPCCVPFGADAPQTRLPRTVQRSSSDTRAPKTVQAKHWFHKPALNRPGAAARMARSSGSQAFRSASYAEHEFPR